MVSLSETNDNLFTIELTDIEQVTKIGCLANSNHINQNELLDMIEQNKSNKLAGGIGYCLLGRYQEAVELLKKSPDSKEKYYYLGRSYRSIGKFDKALESFDTMGKHKAESLIVNLEKTETLRLQGQYDDAQQQLEKCVNFSDVSAEYHYQAARLAENAGQYEKAMDEYEKAIELDSHHTKAIFHLGFAYDLKGDEQIALDYYKQIKNNSPVYVNALLNMSVIYEDMREYDKALSCVEMVIKCHPNHQKALLFLKDIESSMVMIYDEEHEKLKTRQSQLLNIPISDFELSVRSRNCLKKMNIKTIGDLLQISENELLSYKNFGETSLLEIKAVLEQKGFSLGMSTENGAAIQQIMPEIEGADQEVLGKNIDDLELSVRSRRCLSRLGIRTINELVIKTDAELLGCKNFGVTSLNEIRERLTVLGLNLRKLE